MVASIRLIMALPIAFSVTATRDDAPRQLSRNDRCANAAEITAWPFRDSSDSLLGVDAAATTSGSGTLEISCSDPSRSLTWQPGGEADGAAWYAIRSAPPGSPLMAEVKGINGQVYADVLFAGNGDRGRGEGGCSEVLRCVEEMGVEDVSGTGDAYPEITFRWIAEEGASYYVRVHAADRDSIGAGYAFYADISDDGFSASVV